MMFKTINQNLSIFSGIDSPPMVSIEYPNCPIIAHNIKNADRTCMIDNIFEGIEVKPAAI